MTSFAQDQLVRTTVSVDAERDEGNGIVSSCFIEAGTVGTAIQQQGEFVMVEFDPYEDGGGWLGDIREKYLEPVPTTQEA